MKMFKYTQLEAPFGMVEGTIIDSSVYPPVVKRLFLEIVVWQGDALMSCYPCFIVTDELKESFMGAGLTGITFEEVLVKPSITFQELYSEADLPAFWWMKVSNGTESLDFRLTDRQNLLVSESAQDILEEYDLVMAEYDLVDLT